MMLAIRFLAVTGFTECHPGADYRYYFRPYPGRLNCFRSTLTPGFGIIPDIVEMLVEGLLSEVTGQMQGLMLWLEVPIVGQAAGLGEAMAKVESNNQFT